MIKKLKFSQWHFFEFGLTLLFLGTSISQTIRLMLGKYVDTTSFIYIIALLMMYNWTKNPLNIFNTVSKKVAVLLSFLICILIIALFTNPGDIPPPAGVLFVLFPICFILVLLSKAEFDGDFFIRVFFITTGIINVFIFFKIGFFSSFNIILDSSGNILAERTTIATVSGYSIIAIILCKTNSYLVRILKGVFFIVSISNLISAFRRGIVIVLVLILIINFFVKGNKFKLNLNLFRVMIIGLLLFLIYIFNDTIHFHINNMFNSVFLSVKTLLGFNVTGAYRDTASAEMRNVARTNVLSAMKDFGVLQWLFGKGYGSMWIDFPFLEAFYDLGLFYGVSYFLIQSYIPFKSFITKKSKMNNSELLLFYLFFLSYLNNFYSGLPYGIAKFMFIIPIYFDYFSKSKSEKLKKSEL